MPSRKISQQGDPFVTNLKSVSQLIISNRSNVRKKSDDFNGCVFFATVHEKTHTGNKSCENDQKKKFHMQIEAFIKHQKISALEHLLKYNHYEKAFHRKTAFIQKLKLSACPRTPGERNLHKSSKNWKFSYVRSKHIPQKAHCKCNKLGKSFCEKSNLIEHQRIHTRGKLGEFNRNKEVLQKSSILKMSKLTQERKLMTVTSVGNPSMKSHVWLNIRELTQQKNPVSVMTVRDP